VVIQIPSGHCIFRTADDEADVDEWVEAFDDSVASNLKVYEFDPRGAYELKLEKGETVTPMPTKRLIGFCR
jgi:hypothetical protein